jgi:hypothetical protein
MGILRDRETLTPRPGAEFKRDLKRQQKRGKNMTKLRAVISPPSLRVQPKVGCAKILFFVLTHLPMSSEFRAVGGPSPR